MATTGPNKQGELEKPAGAATPPNEPVIHVIPEKFYGAALKKRVLPEPKKDVALPPGAPKPPQKKSNKGLVIILIVALILVLGGGAAVYFFLFAKKPVVKPANVNAPADVCGNSLCETTETATSCPADCAPKAKCGDGTCDATETAESCPADCKPKAACGNGKCEAPDETYDNCPADCQPPEPVPAKDSDSDGLTDAEETEIYGTDPVDPDTDHDSFVDVNEVLNLFDPAKPQPSMLRDNPGIATYSNDIQKYELLYPRRWDLKVSGEQDREAFFKAPSGEFVEVLVEANPKDTPLMDWFLDKSPGVSSSQAQVFKTRGGYDEIIGPDRMTAFIAAPGRVFVVSYNIAGQPEIRYKATFQMMIASLRVTGPAPTPPVVTEEEKEKPVEQPAVVPPAETPTVPPATPTTETPAEPAKTPTTETPATAPTTEIPPPKDAGTVTTPVAPAAPTETTPPPKPAP